MDGPIELSGQIGYRLGLGNRKNLWGSILYGGLCVLQRIGICLQGVVDGLGLGHLSSARLNSASSCTTYASCGYGSQPNSSRKDTHPETVDFEPQSAPFGQERQYSNPFAQPGIAHPTQQFPTQAEHQGQQGWHGQQNQWGQQTAPAGGSAAAYPQQAAAHSNSSNGGKMVLIAVLILAVLLVIAALGFLVFKNYTSSN